MSYFFKTGPRGITRAWSKSVHDSRHNLWDPMFPRRLFMIEAAVWFVGLPDRILVELLS